MYGNVIENTLLAYIANDESNSVPSLRCFSTPPSFGLVYEGPYQFRRVTQPGSGSLV